MARRRELSAFIKLPFELYRGQENWVPPLISPMNRAMEALGGDIVKRYRLFERTFS